MNWFTNLTNSLLTNFLTLLLTIKHLETLKKTEYQPYGKFLAEVLQATILSNGNPKVVYPLLEANLDKLDANLAKVLQRWATNIFEEVEEKEAQSTGVVIFVFSNRIAQFPLGNKASNIEIAIAGYEVLLRISTQKTSPQTWADIQNNLGNTYSKRILGNKAENLENAIAAYQAALTVRTKDAFPYDWALTQYNLGNAYFQRIKGNKGENLENAIAAYNAALAIYNKDAFPYDWAQTQHNLGSVYIFRIKGNKASNLENAIAAYQAALTIRTKDAFPYDWAQTQIGLGLAYSNRIKGNKSDNLEKAITAFQVALIVYTQNTLPIEWARIQDGLGSAYRERILGDKASNLESAIAAHETALTVYTQDALPIEWANTQNNLGNAYRERILGDKASNLEKAITLYEAALTVRTQDALPFDWALTQNNLGNAYLERILGNKASNLEKAIAAYEAALTIYTQGGLSYDWARTQHNLGIVYTNRIQGDKAKNLEKAISAFQAALIVYTQDAFPYEWANTQNNLGLAYKERIGGNKAENLEKAIAAYEAALTVYTQYAFPYEWAKTQNNLGSLYFERIKGDKVSNLEKAIAAYEAALTVITQEAFGRDNAETLFNLGLTYKYAKRFNEAYTSCEKAIETIESLRGEIISGDETKRKQAEQWNKQYRLIVEVCLELGNITEAIEYAERSKTRNLVELILERDSSTIFPPEVITQLEKYKDEIAIGQYQIQNSKAENPQVLGQHLRQLRQQRNELQNCYLPVGSGFKFDSFQATLDEHTAIVEWYTLDDKILAFIIKPLGEITVWKSQPKDKVVLGSWGFQYLQNYNEQKDQWQNSLGEELEKLASILHMDEILSHIPKHCDKLILIPHRLLHLLPLHALPVTSQNSENSSCLLDLFAGGVSYAPSCQILQQIQQQQRNDFESLFAIQNPTEDLNFADLEVENILPYFTSHQVLSKEQATKAALSEATSQLKEINYLHFSCHGYFNLESPRNSFLQLAGADISPIPANANPKGYLIESDDKAIDLSKCLTLDNLFERNFDLSKTRLVVLSACETGLIDFNNTSDEYIGLPSGFIYAGGSSVISSLWKVNELSTSFLLIKFIQILKDATDISVPLAMNKAQLWLRDATKEELQQWVNKLPLDATQKIKILGQIKFKLTEEKPFNLPYHWAAFTAVGK